MSFASKFTAAILIALLAASLFSTSAKADEVQELAAKVASIQRALDAAKANTDPSQTASLRAFLTYREMLIGFGKELERAKQAAEEAFTKYQRLVEAAGRTAPSTKVAARHLNHERVRLSQARQDYKAALSSVTGALRAERPLSAGAVLPLLGLTPDSIKTLSDEDLVERLLQTNEDQVKAAHGVISEDQALRVKELEASLAEARRALFAALRKQGDGASPGRSAGGTAAPGPGLPSPLSNGATTVKVDCRPQELAAGRNMFASLFTPTAGGGTATAVPTKSLLQSVLKAQRDRARLETDVTAFPEASKLDAKGRAKLRRDKQFLADQPGLLGALALNEIRNTDSRVRPNLEKLIGTKIDPGTSAATLGDKLLALDPAAISAEIGRPDEPRLFELHICVEARYGGQIESWREPNTDVHWRTQKVAGAFSASAVIPLRAAPPRLNPVKSGPSALKLNLDATAFAKRAFENAEKLRDSNARKASLRDEMREVDERVRFDFWLNVMRLTLAIDHIQSSWMLLVAPWETIEKWQSANKLTDHWYATLDSGSYSFDGIRAVPRSADVSHSVRTKLLNPGTVQHAGWLGRSFYPWVHVIATDPQDFVALRSARARYDSDMSRQLPLMRVEEQRLIAAVNTLLSDFDDRIESNCLKLLADGEGSNQICLKFTPMLFFGIPGRWDIREDGRRFGTPLLNMALASKFGAPAFELFGAAETSENPSLMLAPKEYKVFPKVGAAAAAKDKCSETYKTVFELENSPSGKVQRAPDGFRFSSEWTSGATPSGSFSATLGPGEWPCYAQVFSFGWRLGPVE